MWLRASLHTLHRQIVIAFLLTMTLVYLCGMPMPQAQAASADDVETLSPQELGEVTGRIALYSDELLALVLPASTFPLQIVQAARFLEKKKNDPSLQPDEDWDPSVLGLLNYPEVITMMNEDLQWTWELGQAVVHQQQDVMAAIQQVREQAHAAGNLESNDKQIVVKEADREKEVIVIKPANPEIIYVPMYDPQVVIIKDSYPPCRVLYSAPYPVYHSPAAPFYTGMFVGRAVGYGFGWWHNRIHITINHQVSMNWRHFNRAHLKRHHHTRTRSILSASPRRGRPGIRTGGRLARRPTPHAARVMGTHQGAQTNRRVVVRRDRNLSRPHRARTTSRVLTTPQRGGHSTIVRRSRPASRAQPRSFSQARRANRARVYRHRGAQSRQITRPARAHYARSTSLGQARRGHRGRVYSHRGSRNRGGYSVSRRASVGRRDGGRRR